MKKLVYMALLGCAIASCSVEDKGHYDYTELNTVTIGDVDGTYEKMAKIDVLNIEPKIEGSISGTDDSQLKYTWFFCTGKLEHKHTVISNERNLNWPVDLNPGTYQLYLQIDDQSTGLQWIKSVQLVVSSTYTTGFMLYGEGDEGEARLDMVVMPVDRDTVVAEKVYEFEEPMYKPTQMFFSGGISLVQKYLYLCNEERDMKVTCGTYFEKVGDFTELGVIETDQAHKEPIRIRDIFPRYSKGYNSCRNYRKRGYITDDMIFVNSLYTTEIFSTPLNKYLNSTTLFKPYPMAFTRGACYYSQAQPMFYDMDNNCFVRMNNDYSTSSTYCLKINDNPGDPFPWNQESVGRTLVYGENGYERNDGDCHALMKDNDGNYFIYNFQPAQYYYTFYAPTKKGCFEIDKSIATDFDNAELYAFSSNKTAILYTVGSKLWVYDYSRKQIASIDLGAEITCLKQEYASTGSFSDIILATYDAATKKGVVRKLGIVGDTDHLEIEEKPREIWDVTMKVLDIHWKNVGDNEAEERE